MFHLVCAVCAGPVRIGPGQRYSSRRYRADPLPFNVFRAATARVTRCRWPRTRGQGGPGPIRASEGTPMDASDHASLTARERAAAIRDHLTDAWDLLTEAYRAADWLELGYGDWGDYLAGEFPV